MVGEEKKFGAKITLKWRSFDKKNSVVFTLK